MKPLNDEQFRTYFLGELPAPEAEVLEEKCAFSAELTAQAQMVERELIDDYLRGNLSAAEMRLFKTNYLITEARREKLQIAQAIWRIASERPSTIPVAADSFWQTVFSKRRIFQLAFGGLILLLVLGGICFYLLTLTVDKTDVAEVRETKPLPKVENPAVQNPDPETDKSLSAETVNSILQNNSAVQNKEVNKESNSPQKNQPEIKPVATPKPGGQTSTSLAIFTLFPGNLRDVGEQYITIAPGTKNVNLHLKLPKDVAKYQIYRAVLKNADGAEIFTSPNSKNPSLTISAEKLENRTYIVFLEGESLQNGFESVTEYTFRVSR